MISTLLVTSHTDLELYGFDVNYVPAISKYSITCISLVKKSVVVGLTPKQCTFCVCSDDIHIVSDISYKNSKSSCLGVVEFSPWPFSTRSSTSTFLLTHCSLPRITLSLIASSIRKEQLAYITAIRHFITA